MNRLYFVRHGENRANLTKEFSSRRVDYSLTSKGVLQARQTAEWFRHKQIDAIYASPLKRARETAEILAAPFNLPVVVLDGLREVDVGDLELEPPTLENWSRHNQIFVGWLKGQPELSFPGGEDYFALWNRMRGAVEEMMSLGEGKNIIAVSHGGILAATLQNLCPGIDRRRLFDQENHNCAITEIILGAREGRIEGELVNWASYDHLHGEAAELVSGFHRT